MGIKVKMSGVSGSFDFSEGKLVSVSSQKDCCVELCLSESMNIPVAKIKLYDRDRYVDAKEVFSDAVLLGKEIEDRWNSHASLKDGASAYNEALNFALDKLDHEDAQLFLRMWREGSWGDITDEFPEFNQDTIKKVNGVNNG